MAQEHQRLCGGFAARAEAKLEYIAELALAVTLDAAAKRACVVRDKIGTGVDESFVV
jgi:hypothetical protein